MSTKDSESIKLVAPFDSGDLTGRWALGFSVKNGKGGTFEYRAETPLPDTERIELGPTPIDTDDHLTVVGEWTIPAEFLTEIELTGNFPGPAPKGLSLSLVAYLLVPEEAASEPIEFTPADTESVRGFEVQELSRPWR